MQTLNQNVSIDPVKYFANVTVKNIEYCLDIKDNLPITNANLYKEYPLAAVALSIYLDVIVAYIVIYCLF